MRTGCMLVPSWLAWRLISAKSVEDAGSEVVGQLALQDFIERGELDRHLRRMRLRYQRRRGALLEALDRWLPEWRPAGAPAGLFELVELSRGDSERGLIDAARERGVGLEGLSLHSFRAAGPPGLVIGFANLAEPAIEQGVRRVAESRRGL
jgi:GntR family transcriptional regulator / MocR family aminotransferase